MREQSPGPAHAALYFVVNQQNAELVTGLAQGPEVAQVRRRDPALTLDRLDQHSSGFFGNRCAQFVGIVERDVVEATNARTKALQMLGIIARRDRRQCTAVKG